MGAPCRATTTATNSESNTLADGSPNPNATPQTPIEQHPLIKHAMELFSARVTSVTPRMRKQEEQG